MKKKTTARKVTKKATPTKFGPAPKLKKAVRFTGSSDDMFGRGAGGGCDCDGDGRSNGIKYTMEPDGYHEFFESMVEVTPTQAGKLMDKPLRKRDSNRVVQWYKYQAYPWHEVEVYGKDYNHRVYRYMSNVKWLYGLSGGLGKYADLTYWGTDYAR